MQAFFDRWIAVIPTPLTVEDRAADFWRELSTRQVEVSRALVLDDPRRARSFFEALVADNIGIGRPEAVSIVFAGHQVRRNRDEWFGTRVFSPGTEVRVDFRYKHSRIKQYLKDGRAPRIETVINNPSDLDDLRPQTPAPARPHPTPPAQQHLHAHQRTRSRLDVPKVRTLFGSRGGPHANLLANYQIDRQS